jgi:amidohydrolase
VPRADDIETIKERVGQEVDRRAQTLIDASVQIHAHPELGFEETFAHDLLTGLLAAEGVDPERGAFGLATAFAARAGTDGPTVAVLCEYDALPGLGHACGHNIIATAGLGAGLAAAVMADELRGRIVVLGTPAEEGGGGKQLMADAGAFDGVDAAMMVHPAGLDLSGMHTLAVRQLFADYEGVASHASAAPHEGRNALDAAVLGYVNVAALRQHIRPTERIHGIFTKAGDKPNIVPATAQAHWFVRSETLETLETLSERVDACLRAGATATGCTMTRREEAPRYAEVMHNEPMGDAYVANAARLGRRVQDHRVVPGVVGSTDMGNVSQLVPSIHPMIGVPPTDVAIHTAEFERWAGSDHGHRAVIDGAKTLAMTVVDLWLDPDLMTRARTAFAAASPSTDRNGPES